MKDYSLTFGVFFKNSASAPFVLDSVHSTLSEAEQASAKLFNELEKHLTWPGFGVLVEPVDEKGAPTWTNQLNLS